MRGRDSGDSSRSWESWAHHSTPCAPNSLRGGLKNVGFVHPLAVDMGDLSEYYGAPTVRINLGGMLVKLINAANDDPGSGALMEHLDTIRIDVYRTDGETGPALRHVEAMTQRLPKSGWEAVVQVRDMGDHAHILVKMDAETIVGMVVMAVSEEEAVFINIEGMIDPDSLAELTRRFDVDLSGDEDDGG